MATHDCNGDFSLTTLLLTASIDVGMRICCDISRTEARNRSDISEAVTVVYMASVSFATVCAYSQRRNEDPRGQDGSNWRGPGPKGPTAKAQQHAGEPITPQALHDITEGEKKITGGERIKGGPTSTAQSEREKSRNGK